MIVEPGRTLAEKYQLVSLLGQGGMGSVWRAEHLTLRSPVAIKLIDPALIQNPEALERFMREAQSAASLRSPHVVQILDYGLDDEVPYIVMELLEGESLASRLKRLHRLSPADTARIILDVCRAVGRAHQAGIVHRDLKPDNIFLVPNDESEVAKVLDFGIAKSSLPGMSLGSGTRTGSMLGTPYYMSPEQASGSKTVDWRSDLWALGIIAFECMTGALPFNEDTLGGLVLSICTKQLPLPSTLSDVPPGFDEWFSRASARNKAERFQSAKELAQALSQVCGADERQPALAVQTISVIQQPLGSTTGIGSMTSTGMTQPRPAGHGARWVLASCGLLVVFGVGGFAGWKMLASSGTATTSLAGAAATALPAAPTAAAQPTPAATPSQQLEVVPATPASAAAVLSANPVLDSRRHPVVPARPVGGARPLPNVVPVPQAPAGSQPTTPKPAAPITPTANPDPLGI